MWWATEGRVRASFAHFSIPNIQQDVVKTQCMFLECLAGTPIFLFWKQLHLQVVVLIEIMDIILRIRNLKSQCESRISGNNGI